MSNPPRRNPLAYPSSLHFHIMTRNDREREELFNEIIKLLDARGIKYNPGMQYHSRRWPFLQAIEVATLRDEGADEPET